MQMVELYGLGMWLIIVISLNCYIGLAVIC